MLRHTCFAIVGLLTMAVVMGGTAWADDAADKAELAKKTLNPVADLISLPSQVNYDRGIGPTDDGKKYVVNIQPVIPISIGPEWNVISRTILPLVDQDDILPDGEADASGIGDTTQSFFFSPKKPTARGWIWGAGPVLLLPTASDDDLVGCGGTATGRISVPLSCSRFSPTPQKRLLLLPSIPSRAMTGWTTNGRCPSTSWSARS